MLKLKSSQMPKSATPPIDMTPMIDMVFQLLIFFLLTSIFAAQPILDLALPPAKHAQAQEEKKEVHLVLKKEGKVFIGEEEIAMGLLPQVLKEKMGAGDKKTLFLSADQEVPFRFFVRVLDMAKGLGLSDLAILTQPAEDRSE